ncbi:MAG TPA: DUF5915 domain-containing protein, partial [Gemmatimonadaceae bacterium]|nr:DUF5915 domain-containing protein [Gemmatimonadaceae bacterium]
ALRRFVAGEPLALSVGGESHVLDQDDLIIKRSAVGGLSVAEEEGYFAAIDPTVTAALRAVGLAREVVSRVQRMRKEAALAVSDRIVLAIAGHAEIEDAVRGHREWVMGEVLARELAIGDGAGDHQAAATVDLDGRTVRLAITRVS